MPAAAEKTGERSIAAGQGAFCNEHTYQCFLTDVHAACCDEGGLNCPDGQDIPNTCPVGCAIVFPGFLETCRDHVRTQAGLEEAEYESFEQQCERSPPRLTHKPRIPLALPSAVSCGVVAERMRTNPEHR